MKSPAKPQVRTPPHTNPHKLCVICGGEAKGFKFRYRLSQAYPEYDFCSRACQDIGAKIAGENDGMIDTAKLTDMERSAIKDARQLFANALTENGLMNAFLNCTPQQIDQVIAAAWEGCRISMIRQSACGDIPL